MSQPLYLDHAATSWPKAPGVSRAVARFLDHHAGNPGRGGHRLSVAASRAVEDAREAVAFLLGGDPERTLFGASCTFWLNTVLSGTLEAGDRVVCSALEHNAVMRPLRWLEATRDVQVCVVEGDVHGVPSAQQVLEAVASAPTRLVVLTHASNVTGAVLPVESIARAIAPVPLLVDAAQTAGAYPLDFQQMGAAALCCSAHKGLLAPPGVGVLLLATGFVPRPLVLGGTGSRSESELMPTLLPDRLEAGTLNTAGIAGLGAACAWLEDRGITNIHHHEIGLAGKAARELAALPGVRVLGHEADAPRTGTLSFVVEGADNGELALWLDRSHGIQLRQGLHCAPAAHRTLGTMPAGTLRVGFGPSHVPSDVERLVDAVGAFQRR